MAALDETHDPRRRSWVGSANRHPDFPIQNLPLGIFTPPGGEVPRGGVAIGDMILDLSAPEVVRLLAGDARRAAEAAACGSLNALFALGAGPRWALRAQLSELLAEGSSEIEKLQRALRVAADCRLALPARVGDYTDFYVGIHHATNVGKMFRPDSPLLPNYKYVPIAYHGRASSIILSGTPIRRPNGQRRLTGAQSPSFGVSRKLDYELELGVWIGPGNPLGEPIPIERASAHVAGFCLLNDWSARDIQAWEYQPLGPFLAKNFASTVSPWVVTPEALMPFRIPQPLRLEGDPAPLPYLQNEADESEGAFDIELEVLLLTQGLREKGLPPHRLGVSSTRHMYWTVAQMLAHHTCNGCNLRPGDLIGTGTLSGPDDAGCGSLLEATKGGENSVRLSTGEERRFLEDSDEVILRGRASRAGAISIGFGECRATIVAAAPLVAEVENAAL